MTGTTRLPAQVAGGGIVAMAVLAGVVAVAGPTGLLTGGHPTATLRDVLDSPESLRLSIAALVLVALLDVLVAWGLLEVFTAHDPGLARLAAWLRLAYAAVFAVAIAQLVAIPDLLSTGGQSPPAAARLELTEFRAVWQVALALFGLHLVLVGRLAWTSRLVPRVVAVLVALAGLGYLVDSFGFLVSSDYTFGIGGFTAFGELLLGLWLLARNRTSAPAHDRPEASGFTQVPLPSAL
jgi:hypothetical protein